MRKWKKAVSLKCKLISLNLVVIQPWRSAFQMWMYRNENKLNLKDIHMTVTFKKKVEVKTNFEY